MKKVVSAEEIACVIVTLDALIEVGNFRKALERQGAELQKVGGRKAVLAQLDQLSASQPALAAHAAATLAELAMYLGRTPAAEPLLGRYRSDAGFLDLAIPTRAKLQMAEYLHLTRATPDAVKMTQELKDRLTEAMRKAVTVKDLKAQCQIVRDLGDCDCMLATLYSRQHRYQMAERAYEEGLAQLYTHEEGLARVYARVPAASKRALQWRLGLLMLIGGYGRWRVGQLTTASNRLHQARDYLQATGDFIRHGAVALGMGCVHRSLGAYDQALTDFLDAGRRYAERGAADRHEANMVRAWMNEGVTHQALASTKEQEQEKRDCLQKADQALQRAEELASRLNNPWLTAEVCIRRNWYYLDAAVKEPWKGLDEAHKALQQGRLITSDLLIFEANIALGNAYLQLADDPRAAQHCPDLTLEQCPSEAEKCFVAAFEKAQQLRAGKFIVEAHLALADLYCHLPRRLLLAQDHYSQAKAELEREPNDFLDKKAEKIATVLARVSNEIFRVDARHPVFKDSEPSGLKDLIHELQQWTIARAAAQTHFNKTAMARKLRVSRVGLDKLIKRHFGPEGLRALDVRPEAPASGVPVLSPPV